MYLWNSQLSLKSLIKNFLEVALTKLFHRTVIVVVVIDTITKTPTITVII